jgi:hypothetical protein
MKKLYQELDITLILFEQADIVTLSDNEKDDLGDDIFGPQ